MGETERGRTASTPVEIPVNGWWDILRRVFEKLGTYNVSILSAGVAFYAMLSIFPALAAIVTIYALVSDPTVVQQHFSSLSGFIPSDVTSIISEQLASLASRSDEGLGLSLSFGVLAAVWSAHRAVDALVRAITVVYEEKETRGILKINLLTFGVTLGAVLFIVLILVLLVVIPTIMAYLPQYTILSKLAPLLRWALFIGVVVFAIGYLYRVAPPRVPARWRWLSVGAVLATMLWFGGSLAFSYYVQQFDTYNQTYGTLGAIIVLLMWFYLTTYSVILGAALNAEMEHQTRFDTTVGERLPMGERGAYVADHLGETPR